MADRGKIYVVSGPSGAGKTTLVTQALARLKPDLDIDRIITYTTRAPREGEIDGKDYIFLSREKFLEKQADGFFLETTDYMGHLKGSPKPEESELESGKSFVLVVDLEGSKTVAKTFRDAMFIWVAPPDMTALKKRLSNRGTESASGVEKRLVLAKQEMEEAHKSRLFDYVLVNDLFDQSVEELLMLVKKEK